MKECWNVFGNILGHPRVDLLVHPCSSACSRLYMYSLELALKDKIMFAGKAWIAVRCLCASSPIVYRFFAFLCHFYPDLQMIGFAFFFFTMLVDMLMPFIAYLIVCSSLNIHFLPPTVPSLPAYSRVMCLTARVAAYYAWIDAKERGAVSCP